MAEAIISQEGNTSSDWSIAELNYTIDDDWVNINTDERFMGIIDPVYTNYLNITYPIVFNNNREFNNFGDLYTAVGNTPENLFLCYSPYGGQWIGNREVSIPNIAYTDQLSYIVARVTSPPSSPIYLAAKFIN